MMPLALPTVHSRLMQASRRFYPHQVTVQRDENRLLPEPVRDAAGNLVEDWQNLDGHVDIAARVVSNGPGTGAGGWSGTIRAEEGTYDVEGVTAALNDHYPDIRETDRMVWRSRIYPIDAVEHDAEGVTTRLRTRKVT